MKDIPDEVVVEFGYQIPDRVLQPGRPDPTRHHSTDYVLRLFRVPNSMLPPRSWALGL